MGWGKVSGGGKPLPSIFIEEGYEILLDLFIDALARTQSGKGKERHSENKPFSQQDIVQIPLSEGHGFTRGQVIKKIKEAKRLNYPNSRNELLDSIIYLFADIIVLDIEEHNKIG
jgi:hypothetical protein